MKKLFVTAVVALGFFSNSLNANLVTNAIQEKLGDAVGNKLNDLGSLGEILPGNISNAFKGLSTDLFGGLSNLMFKGLDTVSFDKLSQCYVPENTSSNLDVCGWATALDDLFKGDFCNLVPQMPGWRKVTDKDTKFDYSFGAREWCDAQKAKYGSAVADLFDNTSAQSSVNDDNETKKCKSDQARKLNEMFSMTNLSKLDKNSYVYKAAINSDGKTLRLIRDFYTSSSANNFPKALCEKGRPANLTNVKKPLDKITEEDIYKNSVPKTVADYEEDIRKAIETKQKTRQGFNNISQGVSAYVAKAEKEANVSTDIAIQTQQAMNGQVVSAIVNNLEMERDGEIKAARTKYRNEMGAIETTGEDYVQALKPSYQKAARITIQKQKNDEIAITNDIMEKYDKKIELAKLMVEKEVIMQSSNFPKDIAKKEIANYISCANDSSQNCKELLGWE